MTPEIESYGPLVNHSGAYIYLGRFVVKFFPSRCFCLFATKNV